MMIAWISNRLRVEKANSTGFSMGEGDAIVLKLCDGDIVMGVINKFKEDGIEVLDEANRNRWFHLDSIKDIERA